MPTSSDQPSTSTNSISLNGRDTSIGESITMPIDISTLATTRSMMTNGIKMTKPIWNAVLSSLIMNAGTIVVSGIASALS